MLSPRDAVGYAKWAWELATTLRPAKRWVMNRLRLGFATDLQRLLSYITQNDGDPDWFEVCNRIAGVWMSVTNETQIHATVKAIAERKVLTVGRSESGLHGRTAAVEEIPIEGSTAFSRVTGQHPLVCFVGKDLHLMQDKTRNGQPVYRNNRSEFHRYLRSTAVFPVYVPDPDIRKRKPMGFLTFDSIDARGFRTMPDFFAECDADGKDLKKYYAKLERCACYHLGCAVAQVVAGLLTRYLPPPEKGPLPSQPQETR